MPESFRYVWNEKKNKRNIKKHKISFDDAKEVFDDQALISIFDEAHSDQAETRWITIGMMKKGQLCVVIHTEQESTEETLIRIISARPATSNEKKQYISSREEVR